MIKQNTVVVLLFSACMLVVLEEGHSFAPTSKNTAKVDAALCSRRHERAYSYREISSSSSSIISVQLKKQQQQRQHQQGDVKLYASSNDGNNNGDDDFLQKLYDERPDKSILLSSQDATTQQLGIAALTVGLGIGTYGMISLYNALEEILPTFWYSPFYSILPLILSTTFVVAGIAHFVIDDTFTAFVPKRGSWGNLWNVPAPGSQTLGLTEEQYHCYWTGIAEIGAGTLCILTKVGVVDFIPQQLPTFLLFLITVAVTPANIYMFTHDPDIPRIPPLPYPFGHAARGALQCGLLAVFWKLSFHTY